MTEIDENKKQLLTNGFTTAVTSKIQGISQTIEHLNRGATYQISVMKEAEGENKAKPKLSSPQTITIGTYEYFKFSKEM